MQISIGDRVRSRVHGSGTVVSLRREFVGVNFASNTRDNMTDCWYRDCGDGRYTTGMGIDVLTFEDMPARPAEAKC